MKKEDGAYAKYATAQLLALGYQSRLGVIAAGSHGAAQVYVIFRASLKVDDDIECLVSLALFSVGCLIRQSTSASLPATCLQDIRSNAPCCQRKGPPATSRIASDSRVLVQTCEVTFISEKDKEEAFPMVLNEDVITDLPEVSNFCLSDNARYRFLLTREKNACHNRICRSEPLRPIQAWLRRSPDENALDLEARSNRADKYMSQSRAVIRDLVESRKKEANKPEDIPVRFLAHCSVFTLCAGQSGRNCNMSAWRI